MTVGRQGAAAVQLGNGRVLIAGGYNPGVSGLWLQSSELYNPANNLFSPVSDMSVVRSVPAGAALPDGKALIAGGFDGSGGPSVYRSSAEIFTGGVSNSYSSTGSMATGRAAATGSPLPDGRVLVAGGVNGSNVLKSAEIFERSDERLQFGGRADERGPGGSRLRSAPRRTRAPRGRHRAGRDHAEKRRGVQPSHGHLQLSRYRAARDAAVRRARGASPGWPRIGGGRYETTTCIPCEPPRSSRSRRSRCPSR